MSSIGNNHQQSSSSSSSAQNHYQHGIPGIPTDGRVVLLKNSMTGAEIYLVGTVHVCEESAELVKKVIDYVRPDVVASKVMIEDRDEIMFTNLRSLQGKVVAVVGMAHMDGIELLWKRAEEDDNSSICITVGT